MSATRGFEWRSYVRRHSDRPPWPNRERDRELGSCPSADARGLSLIWRPLLRRVLRLLLAVWVGWFGFNAGSTSAMSTDRHAEIASNAALTTMLSACAGGVTLAVISIFRSTGAARFPGARPDCYLIAT